VTEKLGKDVLKITDGADGGDYEALELDRPKEGEE